MCTLDWLVVTEFRYVHAVDSSSKSLCELATA